MSAKVYDEKDDDRSFRLLLFSILLFLIAVMLFIDDTLKWVVGLFIILMMGGIIVFQIYEKSRDVSFWERDNELDSIVNLNLERVSDIAGRAYRDRTISKALLEQRIKEEFFKKIKNYKNLSDSKMEQIKNDPNRLRKIIDDDVITKFILESKGYSETVHDESGNKKPISKIFGFKKISINKDYKQRIDEVLKRMEEWN